jgi:hypothetical protein
MVTPANRALTYQKTDTPGFEMPLPNRFDSHGVLSGTDSPPLSN